MSKKFVVDIDGVIATKVNDLNYTEAMPIRENINFFNYLHDKGHKIIYFTARGYESGIDWKRFTESQLMIWGVKYSKLFFNKPSADYYIDDKFITPEELKKEFNYEV